MFWINYVNLCNQRGITPNEAAKACGIKSSGTVTGWKNGALPRDSVLIKLSQYFNVTVDELLSDKKIPATESDGLVQEPLLKWADKDIRLLMWFRSLPPEKQKAILVSQDAPEEIL